VRPWLAEIIRPNREDSTYSHYELMSRLHVIPGIGKKRIDKRTVRDTQAWLNKLPGTCQCYSAAVRGAQKADPKVGTGL
jgi:Phage integrase, N-terminal SAM-like domain